MGLRAVLSSRTPMTPRPHVELRNSIASERNHKDLLLIELEDAERRPKAGRQAGSLG